MCVYIYIYIYMYVQQEHSKSTAVLSSLTPIGFQKPFERRCIRTKCSSFKESQTGSCGNSIRIQTWKASNEVYRLQFQFEEFAFDRSTQAARRRRCQSFHACRGSQEWSKAWVVPLLEGSRLFYALQEHDENR